MEMAAQERPSRFPRQRARIRVSFEFFPPKTEEMEKTLWDSIERLHPLHPSFVSVTYGAAGSTREGTVEVTTRIKRDYGIETMAHLSVVGETIEGRRRFPINVRYPRELRDSLEKLRDLPMVTEGGDSAR